jgi:hypothetical protein
MLTLHGTYEVLLPMRLHSNRYRALIENQGKGGMHRYYIRSRTATTWTLTSTATVRSQLTYGPYCPATGLRSRSW